eukprot:302177-Rhodomonas_salina.1
MARTEQAYCAAEMTYGGTEIACCATEIAYAQYRDRGIVPKLKSPGMPPILLRAPSALCGTDMAYHGTK